MPAYLVKVFMKTVGRGHFDPMSVTVLAVAGGCAAVDYIVKKCK